MRRFTTPTQVLLVDEPTLIDDQLYVTYKQANKILTFGPDNIVVESTDTGIKIYIELAQLQTGGFTVGLVQVQVNGIDQNGIRRATNIATFEMTDNLLRKVIEYDG